MVSIPALWLPILVAAALVFVVSSILHMLLPYHRSDYGRLPREDEVMDSLRKYGIPPGDYLVPCAGTPAVMKTPEFQDKMTRGPVAMMTVMPSGPPSLGPSLALWFVYSIAVGIFAAYLTGRALPPGTAYMEVFRMAGTVAYLGYAFALWQNSIWYKRSWMTTLKSNVDGLIYGLLTAGAFGWLWPR